MKRLLAIINKYLGWRQWAVLRYNSIFENLFILFYFIAIKQVFTVSFFVTSIIFLLLSVSATSLGYLVNDFADRELDLLHGKQNTFAMDSDKKAKTVLVVILGLVILFSLPFSANIYFVGLLIFWLFLVLGYSLPPLRFKERGLSGLILVSIAQRLIPVWMLFSVFDFSLNTELVILSFYILLRGLTSDLNHQLQDYRHDSKTQTETAVVVKGHVKMSKLFSLLLELEKLALLVFLVHVRVVSVQTADLKVVLTIMLIIYMFLYGVSVWKKMGSKGRLDENSNPYIGKHIYQVVQMVFPNLILPIALLLFLSVKNPVFSSFFVFYVFVFKLYDPKTYSSSFLGKVVKNIK